MQFIQQTESDEVHGIMDRIHTDDRYEVLIVTAGIHIYILHVHVCCGALYDNQK